MLNQIQNNQSENNKYGEKNLRQIEVYLKQKKTKISEALKEFK